MPNGLLGHLLLKVRVHDAPQRDSARIGLKPQAASGDIRVAFQRGQYAISQWQFDHCSVASLSGRDTEIGREDVAGRSPIHDQLPGRQDNRLLSRRSSLATRDLIVTSARCVLFVNIYRKTGCDNQAIRWGYSDFSGNASRQAIGRNGRMASFCPLLCKVCPFSEKLACGSGKRQTPRRQNRPSSVWVPKFSRFFFVASGCLTERNLPCINIFQTNRKKESNHGPFRSRRTCATR